ncbi:MAG: hypothetical protein JST00_01800 [Deltaproteobacteria bacterium]|nr:hypothetical protein [Deltaproteobacteria bacterium]
MTAATSFRDRLPTLPHDLSEYARDNTGPTSWSAHPDAEMLSAWVLEAHDEPAYTRSTALLADLMPTDVPRVMVTGPLAVGHVSHREAYVLASIDGHSTIDTLLDLVDLHAGEVLAIVAGLCARGIVAIDRLQ